VYTILSIDGGGVRGIVAALVLADLERRARRPIAELFDLVAATSTGAIVALALLRPGHADRPARTAQEVAEFYETTSRDVFSRTPWQRVRSADGFLGPKYDAARLERSLRAEFGEAMLSHSLCDVLLTSYDLKARAPLFFKTRDISAGRRTDQPMWLVARATSAAPTYFSPVELRDGDQRRWLIDGGVCANNPSVCAYAEALRELAAGTLADPDVRVVSVGTGAISTDYAVTKTLHGGKLAWATPMFDVVLDAAEDTADYQMTQALPAEKYFRFQADLPEATPQQPSWVSEIDNTSPANVTMLKDSARQLIMSEQDRLEEVAQNFSQQRGGVVQ
jgi:patatin-like phospholipase/acyl hydrolase